MQNDRKLICVGIITSAHGIKGAVKIKSFTQDPSDIANYSPLFSADCNTKYDVKILSGNGEMLIAEIKNITTRNEAEILGGTELYIYRDMLPETIEDEFYYEDLIGMQARSANNDKVVGIITAVYNHGAGDIIEIKLDSSDKTELFIFSKENVPEVNIKEGYITINFPEVEFLAGNDNE